MTEVRVVDGAPTFAFVQAKFTVEVSISRPTISDVNGVCSAHLPDSAQACRTCPGRRYDCLSVDQQRVGQPASTGGPSSILDPRPVVLSCFILSHNPCPHRRPRRRSGSASTRSPRSCPPAKPAAQTSVRRQLKSHMRNLISMSDAAGDGSSTDRTPASTADSACPGGSSQHACLCDCTCDCIMRMLKSQDHIADPGMRASWVCCALPAVTAHYSSMHAAVKMLATRIDLLIQLLQRSQASMLHPLPDSNPRSNPNCDPGLWPYH